VKEEWKVTLSTYLANKKCQVSFEKSRRNLQPGRYGCRWEYDIKTDLREIRSENVKGFNIGSSGVSFSDGIYKNSFIEHSNCSFKDNGPAMELTF
jgi:hypothetical protein